MIKKNILIIIFSLGLIYLLLPGPSTIDDFPAIPNSVKSEEPGDTVQNPNISAYYSYLTRDDTTEFYKDFYENSSILGKFLPSIRLNHPPEYAFQYVRDQQQSTFLEEYSYPLRESLFVNGYEPKIENKIRNREANFYGNTIHINGKFYNSKTTLRFYPTNIIARILIYLGVWVASYFLIKIYIKAFKEN